MIDKERIQNMTDGEEQAAAILSNIEEISKTQNGSFGWDLPAYFCGGKYHGKYMTHKELLAVGNGTFTIRWSEAGGNTLSINLGLEDQPRVDGYYEPMMDGRFLRYEVCRE